MNPTEVIKNHEKLSSQGGTSSETQNTPTASRPHSSSGSAGALTITVNGSISVAPLLWRLVLLLVALAIPLIAASNYLGRLQKENAELKSRLAELRPAENQTPRSPFTETK